MRALRKSPAIKDPAPSKWGYKLQRWMLTPTIVATVRVGVPVFLLAVMGTTFFANPDNRAMIANKWTATKVGLQNRPEFMVHQLRIEGGTAEIDAQVTRVVQLAFPISSFNVELEEIKTQVTALNAVREATVKIADSGTLLVEVTPREPVAIWRDGTILNLLDAEGVFSGALAARVDRPDLPLIAGEGAYAGIDEALALYESAGPLRPRIRGLVRMGERRWDIVLDRDQRIQLPSEAPQKALDRIIVMNTAHDLLGRDIVVLDMRNPTRPTARVTQEATNALRRVSERGTDE